MVMIRRLATTLALAAALGLFASGEAAAQTAKPLYQMEWVYRVKYGFQDEWWRIFQAYEIAALDEEKRRGYVVDYYVDTPDLHASEDARWDYRVIITFKDREAATHEDEVTKALFPDQAAFRRVENRRWELTANHWDLPIHKIDPHAPAN
jgi:hypothetical protein